MKRIAFLSFDWDYEIISEYYLGLQEQLRNRNDVQVVIFNAFGYFYARTKPKESSLKIFSLCRLEDYDGIIVQGNRTWPPAYRQQIVDRAVALGKPVASINYDLDGACAVGTDNYREEYELVRQVLSEKGRKRPAFVTGLKTSVESNDRERGFADACASLGITDTRIYKANWQIESGRAAAQRMLRRPQDLPDVVFCCNDDLAVGVQETLQAAGAQVPDDVMITGFDNRSVGKHTSPRITTVDRDYRGIAAVALDAVVRLIDGEKMPEQVFSPAQRILSESCGYVSADSTNELANDAQSDAVKHYYELLGEFQTAMLDAEELYSALENCERFARELDCPNTFASINDSYLYPRDAEDTTEYGRTSSLVARSGPALTLACDANHVYTTFETRDLLPPEVALDGGLYMVSPLRRNDDCVGMLVTEGVPSIVSHGFFALFLNILSAAIDAVRTAQILREVLARG